MASVEKKREMLTRIVIVLVGLAPGVRRNKKEKLVAKLRNKWSPSFLDHFLEEARYILKDGE